MYLLHSKIVHYICHFFKHIFKSDNVTIFHLLHRFTGTHIIVFRKYNLLLLHLLIGLEKTYDSVKRNELWQIMSKHGFPAKQIRLDGLKSSVRIAD